MSLPRRAARAMLAASFISGGLDQIRNPQPKRDPSQPVIAPIAERIPQLARDPEQLIKLDGAIKVAGGLGMIFGPFARPAALVLAGSLLPTTLAGHRFWEQGDPEQKVSDRVEFFKNMSLVGGLLIAALDTGGRPSVPWLAGKAARAAARAAEETAESVREAAGSVGGAVAQGAGSVGSAVAHGAGAVGSGVVRGASGVAHGAGGVAHTAGVVSGRTARTGRKASRKASRRAAKLAARTSAVAERAAEKVRPR